MAKRMTTTDGWTRVRFGDVVRLSTERCTDPEAAGIDRYVGLEHLEPSDLRIRSWGNVADGVTFTNRFRPGQVLFGKRRAYQRKVAVAEFDGICSSDIYVFEPADDRLLSELLPFVCQTDGFFQHALKTSAGSLSPRTNWASLADYEFELPHIDEQRRAISALGGASLAREAISRAYDAAASLRDSCRDALCDLPDHTLGVPLQNVCQMQNGKAFPGGDYCDEGIRLLRPGNLAPDGTLLWEPSKTTHLPPEWLTKAGDYVVQPGDVLINLTAQSLEDGFMGRVCLAASGDQCLLNQRIGRFAVDSSRILPAFLYRCLQTTRFKMHAITNCEGSKVKHLFWSHLAKFVIPLPPIEAQSRIVEQLAVLDSSCRGLTARQASAMTLHKQLLARMS